MAVDVISREEAFRGLLFSPGLSNQPWGERVFHFYNAEHTAAMDRYRATGGSAIRVIMRCVYMVSNCAHG